MSDRRRRDKARVSDATRKRIEDMAGGWKLPTPPIEEGDADPDLEGAPASEPDAGPSSETTEDEAGIQARPKGPSKPPPKGKRSGPTKPPPRSSRPSAAPTDAPIKSGPPKPPPRGGASSAPPPIIREKSGPSEPPPLSPSAVPPPIIREKSGPSEPPPLSASAVPPPVAREKSGPSKPPPIGSPRSGPPKPPPRSGDSSAPPPIAREKSGPSKPPPRPGNAPASIAGELPQPRPGAAGPSREASPGPRNADKSLPAPAIVVSESGDDVDETQLMALDAPVGPSQPARVPLGSATGTVRLPDAIPRRGGVMGDIAYLFRVTGDLRAAKRELAAIEKKIAIEKESRAHKLVELARHAIGDENLDQTFVGRARHRLLAIEEKRSRHAGAVAAASEKIEQLERKRASERADRQAEINKLDVEVAAIEESLEPLAKRHSSARRKAAALRNQLAIIDEKIAKKQASLVAVEGPADTAAVAAEVATLRAERESIASEEPPLAAEVDDLEPKIASLRAAQGELREKIEKLRTTLTDQEDRVAERMVAVRAGQTVEERLVKDLSSERQGALLELGEALNDERPAQVDARLKGIQKHELAIGTMERRALELRELQSTVERGYVLRGALWLMLAMGVIAGVLFLAMLR